MENLKTKKTFLNTYRVLYTMGKVDFRYGRISKDELDDRHSKYLKELNRIEELENYSTLKLAA